MKYQNHGLKKIGRTVVISFPNTTLPVKNGGNYNISSLYIQFKWGIKWVIQVLPHLYHPQLI